MNETGLNESQIDPCEVANIAGHEASSLRCSVHELILVAFSIYTAF